MPFREGMSPTRLKTTEKIIEICKELFDKNGIKTTSIKEIADNTGLARVTIYDHFKHKDQIIEAILFDYLKEIYIFNFDSCKGINTSTTLKKFMHIVLNKYLTNKRAIRFFTNYYDMFPERKHVTDVCNLKENVLSKLKQELSYLDDHMLDRTFFKANIVYEYMMGIAIKNSLNSYDIKNTPYDIGNNQLEIAFDYLLRIFDE